MKPENKKLLFWGAILTGLYILGKGTYEIVKYTQKGLRNHNPGNLRISKVDWEGKVPLDQNTDGAFEQFQDHLGQEADFWGLRANMINAIAKYEEGARTLRAFGEAWAPASDNNGASDYGEKIASYLNLSPDEDFDVTKNLVDVMHGITRNENTLDPYTDDLYNRASISALQEKGFA